MIIFNKQHDLISIIAPASKTSNSSLKLTQIQAFLHSEGFKTTTHEQIFSSSTLPYFAASKKIRLAALRAALVDSSVKIIWGFRGGYGCTEVVFDCFSIKPSRPKILIGFSDLTFLHFLFNQYYKMPTIHGSMLSSLLVRPKNIHLVMDLLSGKRVKIALQPLNSAQPPSISAVTLGGNLTAVCNLLGTPLHPQASGKILILEDVNERGYHIHRHLMHLKNSKLLKDVAAIVLGDFTNGDEMVEASLGEFCRRHLKNIPAYKATGIGHGVLNCPVILGRTATISNNELTMYSPFRIV